MLIGINSATNKRTHIEDAIKTKDSFVCPICKSELVIKNGSIIKPHFAHKSLKDCDTFSADMSDWHLNWQNYFPKECQEVVISMEIDALEYYQAAATYNFGNLNSEELLDKIEESLLNPENKKIFHRADVCIGNYIIEFQHSEISEREFNERCWFYTNAGYKLIWVLDFTDIYNQGKISPIRKGSYAWKNPKGFIKYFHFNDFKDKIYLFFQFREVVNWKNVDERVLERVTWALEHNQGKKDVGFSKFYTKDYPGSPIGFKNMITKQNL